MSEMTDEEVFGSAAQSPAGQAFTDEQVFGQPPQPSQILDEMNQRAMAGFEPLLTVGSGIIAEPIAGLTGLASLPFGLDTAVSNIEKVRQGLTFQPRTHEGQQALQQFGETVSPYIIEPIQKSRSYLGEKGYELAGPIGGMIGETLPTAAMIATGTKPVRSAVGAVTRSLRKSPEMAFIKAHRLGYKVPPSLAKKTATQNVIEGTAGPVPTKQAASVHNQQITNKLIKQDLGIPDEVALSHDALHAVRLKAGNAYEPVKSLGTIKTDSSFRKGLSNIIRRDSRIAKELPVLAKKDVTEFVKGFNKKELSAETVVEAVKRLRADANTGFRSTKPADVAMANAQKKIAKELENLMIRASEKAAPNLVPDLQNSRTVIAKTYQVQKALKGDNVDAVALARELDKGKPMTGLTREVAEFGQNFKGSAQVAPPQTTSLRPADVFTGIAPAVASGNVTWLAAMGVRPALRKLILSKPYQKLVARMPASDWQAVLALPPKAQSTAMAALLQEFKDQNQNISQED